MSKVKIDREDINRVLLTELLPYECPLIFSNDGLYNIVQNGSLKYFKTKLEGAATKKTYYTIPFNFEIIKSADGDTRVLSVIHPLTQVEFIDFYKRYDSILIHQCSKSPFSLRKISRIAKFCYSPDYAFDHDQLKSNEVETEPEILDRETKTLKSYFTYKPIDLINIFYESREYTRLEQRFNLSLEFDITKCFYNIYTHSISWAVKGKEHAKRNIGLTSFENAFDKLMQKANYNETNGIVVGPEISRIFAEIILQQVDLNVLRAIEAKGLKHGVDYEVRRYVDDYFIFANDKNHIESIFSIFRKELKEFKLYINESKTNQKTSPFKTEYAVGKRETNKLLFNFFKQQIIEINVDENTLERKEIAKIRKPNNISHNFIKDFQCIAKQNNLTYDRLCKEVVQVSKKVITRILSDTNIKKDVESIEKLLIVILDICFYAYSLNITSSITFKFSQLIILLDQYLVNSPEHIRYNIRSKISKDADFVITIFQRRGKKEETNVEILNLLIALKKIDPSYFLNEKRIREIFWITKDTDLEKLSYFQIIVLLYCIDENSIFTAFRKLLLESIKKRFSFETNPFCKAEFTMLFFDLITCPYIDDTFKEELIISTKYATANTAKKELKKIKEVKQWFVDWNTFIDLEAVLKKKEWHSSY